MIQHTVIVGMYCISFRIQRQYKYIASIHYISDIQVFLYGWMSRIWTKPDLSQLSWCWYSDSQTGPWFQGSDPAPPQTGWDPAAWRWQQRWGLAAIDREGRQPPSCISPSVCLLPGAKHPEPRRSDPNRTSCSHRAAHFYRTSESRKHGWAPAPFSCPASLHPPPRQTARCGSVCVLLPVTDYHTFDGLHLDRSWRRSPNGRWERRRSDSVRSGLGWKQQARPAGDEAAVKEVDEQRRCSPEITERF